MRRGSFVATAVASLGVCAALAATSAPIVAASAVTQGRLVKTSAREVLPRHGGTATSLNWGGYAVTPASHDVTAVSSTFVVPKAGLILPGFAATWAGIGGYNSSDLIQAGVTENSLPTNPISGAQYGAWYEILPASETPISNCAGNSACTVAPGDAVTVNIHQTSPGQWDISIADPTEGWTFDKALAYSSTESSAEWILEAPTVIAQTILAGVGTTHFGPTSTFTTTSGGTQTIAQGSPTAIALSPGLVNEATPSALGANGQSFNVCAYAQTCPAP
jgi:hypothetical protein